MICSVTSRAITCPPRIDRNRMKRRSGNRAERLVQIGLVAPAGEPDDPHLAEPVSAARGERREGRQRRRRASQLRRHDGERRRHVAQNQDGARLDDRLLFDGEVEILDPAVDVKDVMTGAETGGHRASRGRHPPIVRDDLLPSLRGLQPPNGKQPRRHGDPRRRSRLGSGQRLGNRPAEPDRGQVVVPGADGPAGREQRRGRSDGERERRPGGRRQPVALAPALPRDREDGQRQDRRADRQSERRREDGLAGQRLGEPGPDLQARPSEAGARIAAAAPSMQHDLTDDADGGEQNGLRHDLPDRRAMPGARSSRVGRICPSAQRKHDRRQQRQDEGRLLGEKRGQRGERGEKAAPTQERNQRAEDEDGRQQIGRRRKPERRGQVLGRQEHQGARAGRDGERPPERPQQDEDQSRRPRVQRQRRQRKRPERPGPSHSGQQPPDEHPEGPVVFAPVQVPDERQERIADVAGKRQEEMIVAEEGRRHEERGRGRPARPPPARAARPCGRASRCAAGELFGAPKVVRGVEVDEAQPVGIQRRQRLVVEPDRRQLREQLVQREAPTVEARVDGGARHELRSGRRAAPRAQPDAARGPRPRAFDRAAPSAAPAKGTADRPPGRPPPPGSLAAASAAEIPASGPAPDTRSGTTSTPRARQGAGSLATTSRRGKIGRRTASWRSATARPAISSSGLVAPPSRRAGPPAMIAAATLRMAMARGRSLGGQPPAGPASSGHAAARCWPGPARSRR